MKNMFGDFFLDSEAILPFTASESLKKFFSFFKIFFCDFEAISHIFKL